MSGPALQNVNFTVSHFHRLFNEDLNPVDRRGCEKVSRLILHQSTLLCQKEKPLLETFKIGYWRHPQVRDIRKCGNSWKKKKNCTILLSTTNNHNKAIISNDLRIMDATFAHNWWTRIKFLIFLFNKFTYVIRSGRNFYISMHQVHTTVESAIFISKMAKNVQQKSFETKFARSHQLWKGSHQNLFSLEWGHCCQLHLTSSYILDKTIL